jgi:hypothetical protein
MMQEMLIILLAQAEDLLQVSLKKTEFIKPINQILLNKIFQSKLLTNKLF